MRAVGCVVAACLCAGWCGIAEGESIWNLQAVNADGKGIHESLDWPDQYDPDHDELSECMVVIEGILLNSSEEYLDPGRTSPASQVYVQDDSGAGVAVYAGKWYQPDIWDAEYERLSKDPGTGHVFQAGDLVRVTGLTLFYKGKTNINERHEGDPECNVTIELIAAGAGMPSAQLLPSVSVCNSFDQTRTTGGERYQGQWCRFGNVEMVGGTWAAGQIIQVSDNGMDTFDVLLSEMGDFSQPAPTGRFSVTGLFDQEDDGVLPYADGYRLWVKSGAYFGEPVAEPTAGALFAIGVLMGLGRRRR